MEEALNDARFKHILSDKRFRRIPKNVQKITVDKRFQEMFKNKIFKEKCQMDMRGRPIDLTPTENLKTLYDISSESSDDDEDASDDDINAKIKQKDKKKLQLSKNVKALKKSNTGNFKSDSQNSKYDVSQNEEVSESGANMVHTAEEYTIKEENILKDKEVVAENKFLNLDSEEEALTDNEVVGENKSAVIDSDASEESEESEDSDSESSSDDKSEEEFDHRWEELREEAPDTDKITRRLAVCNMDWDRIRAKDLFVVFNSFKPPDGCIYSVKIYPSEYGLKRMEEERVHGPPELVEETVEHEDSNDEEDKMTSKYHREKLRQYQINRLKYYYAVVDCDSPETANVLCEQLTGMEYESCSVRFDIRFIPDDMTFEHKPVSSADKMPDPAEYKPRLFVTSALQQVKVDLTWDETDPQRREILQRAFTEPDNIEKDIRDYLASSSGDSEEENSETEKVDEKLSSAERIAKYRALLQSLEEKEKADENKYEMEITWEPGLKEKTEEIVKEKIQKDSLNPFEEMLKKKKEQRKMKKKTNNEASQSSSDESEDSDGQDSSIENVGKKDSINPKKLGELFLMSDSKKSLESEETKKRKGKRQPKTHKEDNFKCNVNDPRFSAIYSSHLYNIDPSDPHFKKTEGNLALIQEKQKKLRKADAYEPQHKRARY